MYTDDANVRKSPQEYYNESNTSLTANKISVKIHMVVASLREAISSKICTRPGGTYKENYECISCILSSIYVLNMQPSKIEGVLYLI